MCVSKCVCMCVCVCVCVCVCMFQCMDVTDVASLVYGLTAYVAALICDMCRHT